MPPTERSPHPPPYKESITVTARMEKGLKARIDKAAQEAGRSVSAEVIHRLEQYEQINASYALFSEFPQVRRALQIVAAMGHNTFSPQGLGAVLWKDSEPTTADFHRAIGMEFYNPKSPSPLAGHNEDDERARTVAKFTAEQFQQPGDVAAQALSRAREFLNIVEAHGGAENADQEMIATLVHFAGGDLALARRAIPDTSPASAREAFERDLDELTARVDQYPVPEDYAPTE